MTYAARIMAEMASERAALGLIDGRPMPLDVRDRVLERMCLLFIGEAQKAKRKAVPVAVEASEIYQLYPKHVGREDALRAITKALKKHDASYLKDKTNQFKEAVDKWPSSYRYFQDGGDRCPHPATWFNAGRYEDAPEEWKRAGSRTPAQFRSVQQVKPTAENEQAQEEMKQKYLKMAEPEKGTFQHAMWEQARTPAAASEMADAMTQSARTLQDQMKLRNA